MLQKVAQHLGIGKVVYGHYFHVWMVIEDIPNHDPSDPAEAVDSDFYHMIKCVFFPVAGIQAAELGYYY